MTKQKRVYETLKADILDGALRPGTRLVLHEVAEQLGVSPIPVREALRLLERDDLVEVEPHTKVVVKALSVEEVLWAAELRVLLEPMAAREATPRVGPRELTAARRALRRLRERGESAEFVEFKRCYREFHDAIYAVTPNRLLLRTVGELRMIARRLPTAFHDLKLGAGAGEDLTRVLAALEAGDADAVYESVKRHRETSLEELREWAASVAGPAAAAAAPAGAPRTQAPLRASLMNLW